MAYEKQTWECGDVITAEKMNHMEEGISESGEIMIVNIVRENNEYHIDKTFEQMVQANQNNKLIILRDDQTAGTIFYQGNWPLNNTNTVNGLDFYASKIYEMGDDGFVLEVDKTRITSDNTIIRNHWTS